jgi:VanZ family protein
VIRWLIWAGFVVAWSIALEIPIKDTSELPGGEFIMSNRTLVTKSIHVCIYAVMTALSAWVPMPARYRWLMMFFLMIHATGSELLQDALKSHFHRTGELRDVGFDNLGILIGVIVSWKWWTRPDAEPPRDQG